MNFSWDRENNEWRARRRRLAAAALDYSGGPVDSEVERLFAAHSLGVEQKNDLKAMLERRRRLLALVSAASVDLRNDALWRALYSQPDAQPSHDCLSLPDQGILGRALGGANVAARLNRARLRELLGLRYSPLGGAMNTLPKDTPHFWALFHHLERGGVMLAGYAYDALHLLRTANPTAFLSVLSALRPEVAYAFCHSDDERRELDALSLVSFSHPMVASLGLYFSLRQLDRHSALQGDAREVAAYFQHGKPDADAHFSRLRSEWEREEARLKQLSDALVGVVSALVSAHPELMIKAVETRDARKRSGEAIDQMLQALPQSLISDLGHRWAKSRQSARKWGATRYWLAWNGPAPELLSLAERAAGEVESALGKREFISDLDQLDCALVGIAHKAASDQKGVESLRGEWVGKALVALGSRDGALVAVQGATFYTLALFKNGDLIQALELLTRFVEGSIWHPPESAGLDALAAQTMKALDPASTAQVKIAGGLVKAAINSQAFIHDWARWLNSEDKCATALRSDTHAAIHDAAEFLCETAGEIDALIGILVVLLNQECPDCSRMALKRLSQSQKAPLRDLAEALLDSSLSCAIIVRCMRQLLSQPVQSPILRQLRSRMLKLAESACPSLRGIVSDYSWREWMEDSGLGCADFAIAHYLSVDRIWA